MSVLSRCSDEVCLGGILLSPCKQFLITLARDTTLGDTPDINQPTIIPTHLSVPAFFAQEIPPDDSAMPSARRYSGVACISKTSSARTRSLARHNTSPYKADVLLRCLRMLNKNFHFINRNAIEYCLFKNIFADDLQCQGSHE